MSLEELSEELNNPQRHPRFLIIDEIGWMCFSQNREEKKKAEKILRGLFNNKQEENRDIIFGWLSVLNDPDKETIAALEGFRKDPTSKQIIKEIQPQIARFNRLYK